MFELNGDEEREHREEHHLDRCSKCEILSTMVRMFEGDAADADGLGSACSFSSIGSLLVVVVFGMRLTLSGTWVLMLRLIRPEALWYSWIIVLCSVCVSVFLSLLAVCAQGPPKTWVANCNHTKEWGRQLRSDYNLLSNRRSSAKRLRMVCLGLITDTHLPLSNSSSAACGLELQLLLRISLCQSVMCLYRQSYKRWVL